MDKVFPYHAAVSAVEEGYIDSMRDPIGRYVPDLVGSASTAGRKSRLVVDLWLRIQVVDSRRPPGRLPRYRRVGAVHLCRSEPGRHHCKNQRRPVVRRPGSRECRRLSIDRPLDCRIRGKPILTNRFGFDRFTAIEQINVATGPASNHALRILSGSVAISLVAFATKSLRLCGSVGRRSRVSARMRAPATQAIFVGG